MPSHACPSCKKRLEYASAADAATFPFCSERCRLVDLGRWLDDAYVISQELSPEDERERESDEKSGGETPAAPPAPPPDED